MAALTSASGFASTLQAIDSRIADRTFARPNPNPSLDYAVVENAAFDAATSTVAIIECEVNGMLVFTIVDDVEVLVTDQVLGARRRYDYRVVGGSWKLVASQELARFAGRANGCG